MSSSSILFSWASSSIHLFHLSSSPSFFCSSFFSIGMNINRHSSLTYHRCRTMPCRCILILVPYLISFYIIPLVLITPCSNILAILQFVLHFCLSKLHCCFRYCLHYSPDCLCIRWTLTCHCFYC